MKLRNRYFKIQLMFLDSINSIQIEDDYLWWDYSKLYYSDYDTIEELLKELDRKMEE